ncbi:MFS general substrate transporter [Myriangium duriaei CBS 260.36]|uniref:MFS general substrate transporter n=1 Tax=Myriangium duriaei CBS 260.36 TaxID=1168546 RepID=A0A9P4MKH3_9PEZI|nr:MFS general substrate transporter [Myriangium duriaei CBS 260.36]
MIFHQKLSSSTLFISALNATIVATAIPTISNDLKSASGYAWIGGAYILANTTSAPIWVKLSDIFGRKSILLSAVGLYFAATILCAVSISMKMLIASRALQGIAGGGLIQLVFVIVSDLYSLRERSLYIGYLEVMWAIAGGTGPVLGGFFTQHINWRWIFWISLPISGTSFILLFFFLRVHNPRTPLRRGLTAVDWYGSAAMLGLMTMLLLGLDFGGTTFAWDSPTVVGLIVAGSLMMVVFIMVEKRLAKYPLMPLDIFSVRSNVACLAVGFFHEFCVVSLEYYLPLFFQTALGRSPLLSGALSAPLSFVTGVSGILTGLIIHRSGRYLELIWVGSALLLVGCGLLMLLSAKSSVGSIIGFEMIIGIGAGLNFEPPILALQAHLPQDAVGTATSTANFIRNIAACLAIVIGGVVFQNTIGEHATALQAAGVPSNLVTSLTGNTAAANIGLISTIQDAKQRLVVHQAFADSVKGIWIMCIAMAAALTLSGLLVDKKHLSSEHEETKTGIKHD